MTAKTLDDHFHDIESKLALVRRNRINELIKKGMTEKQAHDYIVQLDKSFVEAVGAGRE
ncbi:MAG: hypothetical protein IKE60_26455 [Reyranella sp.]|uniref:hypothetical protein n=1 Tax=Reyranella sp. TaxID=1929291 RepID=UPI0025E7C7E2|nr:hypothetical protein [Reyranella sp.]MBR2818232.1 hypothetical protein [Reyranella sp.]